MPTLRKDTQSKATSSVFIREIIAKLEKAPRATLQNNDPAQNSQTLYGQNWLFRWGDVHSVNTQDKRVK